MEGKTVSATFVAERNLTLIVVPEAGHMYVGMLKGKRERAVTMER